MVKLGVHTGNDPAALAQFENWLGRPVDGVLGYTGQRSWSDADPAWQFNGQYLGHVGREIFWSIPLFPQTSSLAEVAAGGGDAYFTRFANTILDSRLGDDGPIYVRTAWEMGGDWFQWGAQGIDDPDLFIQAFRRFADAFQEVSDRFEIVWDVVWDRGDVSIYYPGDAYVDVVSMDFYWFPQWTSTDPAEAFDMIRDAPNGLQWLETFADQHGKATAYSEWGVQGDNAAPFVEKAAAWFADPSHNVVYQTYWDTDGGVPTVYLGRLSDGSNPDVGAAYRDAFGGPDPGTGPEPEPGPSSATIELGSGPHTVTWKLSQDDYQGSAQYRIMVDGQQVGATQTAVALHGEGAADTVTLHLAAGRHEVSIVFLNDAWGGTATTDRNLYVEAVLYDGAPLANAAQGLFDDDAPASHLVGQAAVAPPASITGTDGADRINTNRKSDITVNGGLGADTINLGRSHESITVEFNAGEAGGDTIRRFGAGDHLDFYGYGPAANLDRVGPSIYEVTGYDGMSERFTLSGYILTAADYAFHG